MSAISNRYADIEMWNLDPGIDKRGPFVIVQCGTAPGDDVMKEQMFLLRHDGKWVNFRYFDSTGQSRWLEEMIFNTPCEFMQLLRSLTAVAEIAELPVSTRVHLRTSTDAATDAFSRIYRLIERYQHGGDARLQTCG